jgi:hypothetical protein
VNGRAKPTARRRKSSLPIPRHPYRDSALFHTALGLLLLAVAWLTGGDLAKAAIVAALYIVIAIGWSWYRFRQRLAREAAGSADG